MKSTVYLDIIMANNIYSMYIYCTSPIFLSLPLEVEADRAPKVDVKISSRLEHLNHHYFYICKMHM
jgi:hypothetical protein